MELIFISDRGADARHASADAAQVRAARAGAPGAHGRQHAAVFADEIERLRFIKRLVDESGVNLAGVQQLLSVAEAMQRIRPLMQPAAFQRDANRRRLVREMDQLAALLGLDHGGDE